MVSAICALLSIDFKQRNFGKSKPSVFCSEAQSADMKIVWKKPQKEKERFGFGKYVLNEKLKMKNVKGKPNAKS